MKLPLTLAIITGLLIKSSGRTFVVPITSVHEIIRIEPGAVKTVNGHPLLINRGTTLPIIRLDRYFDFPAKKGTASDSPFLVVVGAADKKVGLIVDELIGNQEIVVKTIDPMIGRFEGVAGCTILGNGSLAMILDVAAISKHAPKDMKPVHQVQTIQEGSSL